MKVGTAMTLVLFVCALVGSVAGTAYYYTQSVKAVESEVFSKLQGIADARAEYISALLEENREKVETAATHQELNNEELKKIRDINHNFYELFVLSPEGKVIASSDESKIGLDKSDDDIFINGKKGTYLKDAYLSKTTNKNSIIISTPQGAGNVLAARIETGVLDEITLDKVGLGETGETFLINETGYAITPLEGVDDAVLKFKVDTPGARQCLEDLKRYYNGGNGKVEEHEEMIGIYLDYLGNRAIVTHSYVSSMKWCLMAKMNEAEVLGSQRKIFQNVSLRIIVVITFILTLVGFLVGRQLNKSVVFKKEREKI